MARPSTAGELDALDSEGSEVMVLPIHTDPQDYVIDPFWYDSDGRNPFLRKGVHGMPAGEERKRKLSEIVKEFPRYGPKMHEWAVCWDDPGLLRELFELGASLDIKEAKRRDSDDRGESGRNTEDDDAKYRYPTVDMQPALHVAAFEGKLECVKVLVEVGHADVNSKDGNDTTPLGNAMVDGREEIVDWLLEHGADISSEGERISDLQAALRSSKVTLVEKVLEHPQSIEQKSRIEPDHLAYAADSRGNPIDTVRYVLQCDCFMPPITQVQIDAVYNSLRFAVSNVSVECVRLMLPFVTRQNDDGSFEYVCLPEPVRYSIFNALEDAMEKQDMPELFELVWETLLCKVAASDTPDPTNIREDMLHRRLISACVTGCVETCRLLVDKYGAEVNHVSYKYSTTPLGRAVGSTTVPLDRRLPVARYLLEEKYANIHLANGEFANGPTPLALIVRSIPKGQGEMIGLLLKNGGPLEEIDDDGLWEVLEETKAGTRVKFYLVLHGGSRYPVRLMTREQLDSDDYEGWRYVVEAWAKKEEWEVWLRTMQVRESDEELAATDPKGRPLR